MNYYKLNNLLTAFVTSWVSNNIGFNAVSNVKRDGNTFLLETEKGNYELTFKKVEELQTDTSG